jgi:hypothetical protein
MVFNKQKGCEQNDFDIIHGLSDNKNKRLKIIM